MPLNWTTTLEAAYGGMREVLPLRWARRSSKEVRSSPFDPDEEASELAQFLLENSR
jgi:hypothetical protein